MVNFMAVEFSGNLLPVGRPGQGRSATGESSVEPEHSKVLSFECGGSTPLLRFGAAHSNPDTSNSFHLLEMQVIEPCGARTGLIR